MLTIFQRSMSYRKPREVREFNKGAWIHLEKPSEDELKEAATALDVEIDNLKDALDPYEAPRLEVEDKNVYTFIRYAQNDSTVPILIVVAPDGLLTVSQQENSPVIDKFITGSLDFYTTQKARFLLLVLAEVNKRYTVALAGIRKEINRSKTRPDVMTSKDIVKFVNYESTVNDYLDALIPQQVVLNKILLGKVLEIHEDDEDLVEDLILSTNQMIESSRAALRTMMNIRGAYTAISTERLNTIIRRLTAITVLLTVPTVITSFYGMNVPLPGGNTAETPFVILGVILLVALLLFLTLSQKKWL